MYVNFFQSEETNVQVSAITKLTVSFSNKMLTKKGDTSRTSQPYWLEMHSFSPSKPGLHTFNVKQVTIHRNLGVERLNKFKKYRRAEILPSRRFLESIRPMGF